jgi:hypothetical protein
MPEMKLETPAMAMARGQDLAILQPTSMDVRKNAPSNTQRNPVNRKENDAPRTRVR